MDMKLSFQECLIAVIFLLFIISGSANANNIWQKGELVVKLSVDDTVFSLNDQIWFKADIRNISKTPVTLNKKQNPYAIAYIKLFDESGTELKQSIKRKYEMDLQKKDDFIVLLPGDKISIQFLGKFRMSEGYENTPIKMILDFDSCEITIPQRGIYSATFNYNVSYNSAEFDKKEFGLKQVWAGNAISNPLIIRVN